MKQNKYYDYKKAKELIKAESKKEELDEAQLFMSGDWYYTAETVFKGGKFIIDLNTNNLKIAGINYSHCATPMIRFGYVDGKFKDVECYK